MEPQQLKKVDIQKVHEKFQSKRELYDFLTQDGRAYLPKLESTNVYFFRQILRGQKEYIKREDVKVSAVPHIEGLTVQDFLKYAQRKPSLLKYIPDERDWVHIDRSWLCDVLYTLDPEGVQLMIDEAREVRKERLQESRNLTVNMKPEFVEALGSSMTFSTHKGRAADLLKDSTKRKRTREELKEVQNEEGKLKENKQGYLREAKRLRTETENLRDEVIELRKSEQLLRRLQEEGFVDEDGNPLMQ